MQKLFTFIQHRLRFMRAGVLKTFVKNKIVGDLLSLTFIKKIIY